MGLQTEGTPLTWSEVRQYTTMVRKKGARQFYSLYKRSKSRRNCFKWGDEIEYSMIKFDHENKRCYLLLKADELIPKLKQNFNNSNWMPEYANYMIEGTPAEPYGHEINSIKNVEKNMRERRRQLQSLLNCDEFAFSLTTFPLLGCNNYTWPHCTPSQGVTRSLFFPDETISKENPRYIAVTKNLLQRRNSKVAANIPIFIDENTPRPFVEKLKSVDDESRNAMKPDHIYMDAAGFGGCSCLQVTFQAFNLDEARHLYDQLAPLTPIMLALSAASPIWRGYLSEIDCRWNVLSESMDDRTAEERGEVPMRRAQFRMFKSRYDSIDCYLSKEGQKYNDIEVVKDGEIFEAMLQCGMDEPLAQHVAHLFIRDPIAIFKEKIFTDDDKESDHFDNIQSTNWQTLRFKPPPINNCSMGWRVEFRPMELQLTDYENAAYSVFLILLTRAILTFKLNLLMPISKVDENMKNAQKRNACVDDKFYFRSNLYEKDVCWQDFNCDEDKENFGRFSQVKKSACEIRVMSLKEIFCGSGQFVGLVNLVKEYLALLDLDLETARIIGNYLELIEKRACGQLMSCAAWMRDFVVNHESYKRDSIVSEDIAYDMVWTMKRIVNGEIDCPEFLNVPKEYFRKEL